MNLKTSKGFTIVELLIVIVVIAILAAISIVAYTGIQNRARNSAALELANQVATKVRAYNAISGSWPTGITGTTNKTFTPAVADSDEAILGNVNVTTSTDVPTDTQRDATAFRNGTSVHLQLVDATTSPTVHYRTGGASANVGAMAL